jgi:chemotaxis protein MotA
MDVSTLAGIVVGIAFIIVGIIINGTLQSFYDLASIMIVLGGTFAATMVSLTF